MRGKGTIKFASIFLLLAGIINIGLMTLVLLNGGNEAIFLDKINVLALLSAIGTYLIGLLQIIGSIIGLVNNNKPEKANLIIKTGMVLIIATIAWFIPELLTYEQSIDWYVYGYSILIPVLYYIGGKQNRSN